MQSILRVSVRAMLTAVILGLGAVTIVYSELVNFNDAALLSVGVLVPILVITFVLCVGAALSVYFVINLIRSLFAKVDE